MGEGEVTLCRPPSSPAVPRRLRLFSDVFRCFPQSPAVPHRPRRSYVVTCRPLAEVFLGRGARRPC